jgi:hypothetical protein
MYLSLTPEETRLLIHHLTQQVDHMDTELIHTDKRELQRALAKEVEALRTLTDRICSTADADEGDGVLDIV